MLRGISKSIICIYTVHMHMEPFTEQIFLALTVYNVEDL